MLFNKDDAGGGDDNADVDDHHHEPHDPHHNVHDDHDSTANRDISQRDRIFLASLFKS